MSSSAAGNPSPPEITEGILRLLPAKSLGRFKSVSKTWCSLISDPQFIKTHLHQNHNKKTTIKLIVITDDKSLYSLDITNNSSSATAKHLTFPSTTTTMWTILGSCNGIVSMKDENDTIFFINPTTKQLWKLPPSPFKLPKNVIYQLYGFGYDSSTDDYKLVSITVWKSGRKSCNNVSVYSLRNNSWKELRNYAVSDKMTTIQFTGVVVNENVHWMIRSPNGDPSMIVGFSLAKEEFNVMKLPDSVEKDGIGFEELFAVGGKLAFFGTMEGLWVMEEYGVGESWTKVCTDGLEIDHCEQYFFIEGVNGDIIFHGEDGVFVYNLEEKRCRNVRIEGGLHGMDIEMGAVYFESLESPVECIREGVERDLKSM